MIFATDLDRTLIYSQKFTEDFTEPFFNVEIYNEKPISYITQEALKLLKELHKKARIIPVTTRNLAQYQRITLFQQEIHPELFVVNNGGTIYYQGKPDLKWAAHIENEKSKLLWSYEEVLECFLRDYTGFVDHYKKSEDMLWLIIVREGEINLKSIETFRKKCREKGWQIDANGRKIYLYPSFLTKWQALSYIKSHYYEEEILCAGDSLFDQEMLEKADFGILPQDAYIHEVISKAVRRTERAGIQAAEDILKYGLERAKA